MKNNSFTMESGKFFIGCNYWASHAGTAMWSDWRADVIEKDLKKLSEEGIEVMRVFPIWPDFQPIELLYGGGGCPVEYRFGEELIPNTEAGRAGISLVAVERFREFISLAENHGLKLIVGLITGWMSGRLFVPPALRGRNVITDKTSIMWQVRFVKYFVKTFKEYSTIAAWDLGNECNCMSDSVIREEAWVWTAAISDAIKSVDSTRPLVSGMHSLTPTGDWRIQDQGELTDILTTHPYPFWTPYTDYDPVNTIRPLLHATAESLFYAGIGEKPCFAEETGTMGPMICSEEIAGDFARTSIFSLWTHDCHGFLWWCAFDQSHLKHAPYDWNSCEIELGMLRENRDAKPVMKEISKAKKLIDSMPFTKLPQRKIDAVCITNTSQDHWAAAYGAFILAKQAGFDIEFQHESQPLKDSKLYLIPCIKGVGGLRKHRWTEILEKVSEGAILYLSIEDGYIADFEKVTGLRVKTRAKRTSEAEFFINDYSTNNSSCKVSDASFNVESPIKLVFDNINANVIGYENDENPAFTSTAYGKGKIFFLALPLELSVVHKPGSFTNISEPYYDIYRIISEETRNSRLIRKDSPSIGITEHVIDDNTQLVILINYSSEDSITSLDISKNWKVSSVLYGSNYLNNTGTQFAIPHNDILILQLKLDILF